MLAWASWSFIQTPWVFVRYPPHRSWPKSFFKFSEEWDLTKIFYEDLCWISSENLVKIFRRKYFMKNLITTFTSKNLKRSPSKFFLKYFWDLWQIFNSNLLKVFRRSSIYIFWGSLKIFWCWDLKKNLIKDHLKI